TLFALNRMATCCRANPFMFPPEIFFGIHGTEFGMVSCSAASAIGNRIHAGPDFLRNAGSVLICRFAEAVAGSNAKLATAWPCTMKDVAVAISHPFQALFRWNLCNTLANVQWDEEQEQDESRVGPAFSQDVSNAGFFRQSKGWNLSLPQRSRRKRHS